MQEGIISKYPKNNMLSREVRHVVNSLPAYADNCKRQFFIMGNVWMYYFPVYLWWYHVLSFVFLHFFFFRFGLLLWCCIMLTLSTDLSFSLIHRSINKIETITKSRSCHVLCFEWKILLYEVPCCGKFFWPMHHLTLLTTYLLWRCCLQILRLML